MRNLTIILLLLSLSGFGQQHPYPVKLRGQRPKITKQASTQSLREQTTLDVPVAHYPIKNMLRVNAHEWDIMQTDDLPDSNSYKTERLQKAIADLGITGIRMYVDVGPGKSADNTLAHWSPNRRGWRIDSGFLALKAKIPGFIILYTLQGAPDTIQAGYNAPGEKNTLYVWKGADRLQDTSWRFEAKDAFVLASRGGTNKNVPDYPIYFPNNTWETRQAYYKGAGFIDMLSPANEPDNQWMTTPIDGYGMAAMCAPFYDSAKKASPNIIVSSPGVASDDTVYLSQILSWNNTHRGGRPSFDRYELHSYGSGMWTYNNNIANGIPPELSTILGAKKMGQYAAKHNIIPYVGEHSYDQHEYSWLGITPISNYTPSERVAYWGVREILGYCVSGMEGSFYYKLYQDWNTAADSSEGLFATSSLLVQYPDGKIVRRLIGDVYKQLHQVGDFVYDRTIIDNDTVKVYVFKYGAQELWMGWTVEKIETIWDRGVRAKFTERFYNYTFPSGTRYDINEDSSGVFKSQPFYGGTVTLSSKPFFILTSTILPISSIPRDRDPLPPCPCASTIYTVELYELYNDAGRLITKKKNVDITDFKRNLPRHHFYILKYYNDKTSQTEKIYKQ
jgi:hypothetical protein